MSKKSKILMVGLQASSVDYEKWPQLSVEKLKKAFTDIEFELKQQGYSARWCLTDTGATAEQKLSESLDAFQPNIVVIGAGVRTDPDHLLLFEKIINAVHTMAPGAKIAFNTNPFDTIEAVKRWE